MPALTMKEVPKPASPATKKKLEDEIGRRAYRLYEVRGRGDGACDGRLASSRNRHHWECHKRRHSIKLRGHRVHLAWLLKEQQGGIS